MGEQTRWESERPREPALPLVFPRHQVQMPQLKVRGAYVLSPFRFDLPRLSFSQRLAGTLALPELQSAESGPKLTSQRWWLLFARRFRSCRIAWYSNR